MSRLLQWSGLPTESVDKYPGVLVPLDKAHLHGHSYRMGRTEFEEGSDNGDDKAGSFNEEGGSSAEPSSPDHEGTGMLEMRATEYSIAGLRREVRRGERSTKWSSYEMKSKLINKAIQDIGMGRYNWQLFILCGFGWFADNLWMQGVSLTLPSLSAEFGIDEKTVRYTTSALFLGLCFGSFFWGIGSDVLGRRAAFNLTLLITSVFGIMASYAPSWRSVCLLYGVLGFGVGGNLPVDGALFLEFLPETSSSLLTLLSVWWPVGQLCSSVIAWYFIAHWPAAQGWRKFVWTIGLMTFVMFVVRCFVFRLFESPKFLLSQGRQAEAVGILHGLAFRNGKKTWLTEEILDAVADDIGGGTVLEDESHHHHHHQPQQQYTRHMTAAVAIKEKLTAFSGNRLRPLFRDRKLGIATAMIWFCWATIGMGYPLFNAFLPQYLSHGAGATAAAAASPSPRELGTWSPTVFPRQDSPTTSPTDISAETYRSYVITSVVGVPGSLLAWYTVGHRSPFLGRRGTLATSTLVSAVFLFLFAELGRSPASQLAFSCVEAFTQNIMYGVLYAYTPEVFPAPVRGAGTGVASFLNRVAGLAAPVIAATIPGDGDKMPIYLSAVLILAAFVGVCLIPIETRGRQRL